MPLARPAVVGKTSRNRFNCPAVGRRLVFAPEPEAPAVNPAVVRLVIEVNRLAVAVTAGITPPAVRATAGRGRRHPQSPYEQIQHNFNRAK